ncbi:DnaA/Hda family protein [Parvibaculum sp.]|uniref:HdaA/DnaA family protein n=2 Tax=Parvibaculum sp. TaxID=2024848 RepID=UPI000C6044FE|nr:DnaA/Hda family protein [Parvibaculum sp.]MAU60570.1 chromosomal replication initiator DnaA [Parvibaculum sp.]MBO6667448.1 chromosomal replication initiator DnaA [Parvibaculum sp.]MBO6692758.1 chromosomal replication initiator DnaA [Parvibaculum sp.]MBO6714000.1 chromosomal replication initiator DnaA [Parvibaculum sp.]|tara:strand:+ start:2715 stop:3404 length:690 start_codon:yes stop_codon:yes gene_type:complete
MNRQLVLELGHRPASGREDFLVAPSNEAAVALIDSWPEWPDRIVALSGPEGSGKTHLAEVWRAASGASSIQAEGLAASDIPSLVGMRSLILEDLSSLEAAEERALFHLINLVRSEGASLLITSRKPVARLPLKLPDLVSRLRAIPQAVLGEPDDALLAGILVKLFDDRQIRVSPQVVSYLASRIERSIAAARSIVEELDRASLSGKRPVTVPLAAEILGREQFNSIVRP